MRILRGVARSSSEGYAFRVVLSRSVLHPGCALLGCALRRGELGGGEGRRMRRDKRKKEGRKERRGWRGRRERRG